MTRYDAHDHRLNPLRGQVEEWLRTQLPHWPDVKEIHYDEGTYSIEVTRYDVNEHPRANCAATTTTTVKISEPFPHHLTR